MEANFEKRLEEKVEVRVREIMASRSVDAAQEPVSTSSVLAGSSCGSTPIDKPHLVDNLTEPVSVRLYVRQQWTTDKVALG
jgi:translation elongation factor EF-Tu-like GTPase